MDASDLLHLKGEKLENHKMKDGYALQNNIAVCRYRRYEFYIWTSKDQYKTKTKANLRESKAISNGLMKEQLDGPQGTGIPEF